MGVSDTQPIPLLLVVLWKAPSMLSLQPIWGGIQFLGLVWVGCEVVVPLLGPIVRNSRVQLMTWRREMNSLFALKQFEFCLSQIFHSAKGRSLVQDMLFLVRLILLMGLIQSLVMLSLMFLIKVPSPNSSQNFFAMGHSRNMCLMVSHFEQILQRRLLVMPRLWRRLTVLSLF